MNKKKTLLAIPLMAVAVIAIGLVGMTNNVFATTSTPTASSANVDQQGQHDGQYGDQTGADNEKGGADGAESSDSGSDSASDTDNLQQ